MKKSIVALALMSAFSGAALAQSQVTLYGVMDLGVSYKDAGAGKLTSLDSGLNSSSRLGFKGSEVLTNDLNVNFNLEMGVKADTGATDSELFGRGAWVGLSGKDFGAVNLGRHKSLTYIYGAAIDPFMDGLLGKTDLMFKINNVRSNSVTYLSSNFSGFSVAAQYGFGEVAGSGTKNSVTSVAGAYSNGPLLANVVWDQVKDVNGNTAIGGEKLLAGVSYDLGKDFFGLKLNAMFQEIKGSTSLTNLKETKEEQFMFGGSIKNGASTFIGSYTSTDVKTSVNANTTRVALGYIYELSKRTNLYTSVAHVENEKSVKILADVSGATAKLFNVGIRHKF
jgi:predicted porin